MNLTWMQRTIAMNLRSLRQSRWDAASPGRRGRFTQEALATELAVSVRVYGALEKGEQAIDFDRMLQLARYLDVSPLDLVSPPPGEDVMLIQVRPRGDRPRTVEAVPVDEFVLWWRGARPLNSQQPWRWLAARGRRRSDIGFADARFADAEGREAGRWLREDKFQDGHKLVTEPLEVPERSAVYTMLEKFWAACAIGDYEAAEWARDAIDYALDTGARRAQGDPDPESPMWAGKRLPLLGQDANVHEEGDKDE